MKDLQGNKIRCNLQELAVPSFNTGAVTSGDTQLHSKPTGSLGEFNHIGKDEYQVAYEKPVSQNPIGISPNNPATGEFHLNGELWKSNENDIDSGDVSQMADMLRQRGFDSINQSILDQLRSGFEWEFNHLTKKDKFGAMTLTVDHLVQNSRYYDHLDNLIVKEGETPMAEMWVGSIPKDRLEIRHGWPVGLKKSKKDSDEQKEAEVIEKVETDRIIHHVKAMNEMIASGNGQSVISNSFVAKLDTEFERRATRKPRYSKEVLLEAINTIIQKEENTFWNKRLSDCPAVPFTKEKFKEFRRRLLCQIRAGCFNETIREIVESKEDPNIKKVDKSDVEAGADAAFGDFAPSFTPLEEDEMDEMSTSAGAGAYSPANWVSKNPRGNVKSATKLGYTLASPKAEYKQEKGYWRKHRRKDKRNSFGKTRYPLGTDGRKVDTLPETVQRIKSVLGRLTHEQTLDALNRFKFILEIRQAIEEAKRQRSIIENSFEAGISGEAGVNNYQTPLNTQNSAFQTPEHFGAAESPNTEMSSSLNGAVDRQNQPTIGDEQTGWSSHSYNECSYPLREDGTLAIEHNGQRFHLSKVVQGTGFKSSQ